MHDDLKIRKLSMADQVCDRIRTLLLDGTWPVGTKLPAEAQLADRFGVNRLTVRIALQKFNALGILETRDGEGTPHERRLRLLRERRSARARR